MISVITILKEQIWRFRKRRPYRYLFIPLYPLVFLLGLKRKRLHRLQTAKSIRKIVTLHFGGIGDALMTTPAIRALNQTFPQARITAVSGSKAACDVYLHNHCIQEVLFLQQYDGGNIEKSFPRKSNLFIDKFRVFLLYPSFVLTMIKKRYDLGVSFGPSHEAGTFANIIFDLVGIPIRLGGFGEHTEFLFKRPDQDLFSKHWVDIYLGIVSPLTAFGTNQAPCEHALEYDVSDEEKRNFKNFLSNIGIAGCDTIVGIHPGGNTFVNSKRWTAEGFAQVADQIAKKSEAKILITGSEEEITVAERVATLMKTPAIVIAGKLRLAEMGALLSKTRILITNDTGVLHLADAVGTKKVISVFGPTNASKIAPRNARHTAVSAKLRCAPCIDFGAGDETKRCWRNIKFECLSTISPSDILRFI